MQEETRPWLGSWARYASSGVTLNDPTIPGAVGSAHGVAASRWAGDPMFAVGSTGPEAQRGRSSAKTGRREIGSLSVGCYAEPAEHSPWHKR